MYRCEIMPINKKGRVIQMDYSDTYIVLLYHNYVDVQNYKQKSNNPHQIVWHIYEKLPMFY